MLAQSSGAACDRDEESNCANCGFCNRCMTPEEKEKLWEAIEKATGSRRRNNHLPKGEPFCPAE